MRPQLFWTVIGLTLALHVAPGFAQEILKHPRVVELEDSLKDGASEYVKSRFPSIPFMVTVRVDPLRRETARKYDSGAERNLPFFEPDEDEEIKDEWDNPQIPLKALINRVKRIQVNISVPAKLKETEVSELKDGILNVLHLTPARDEVAIARRDWVTEDVPWFALYATGATLVALLLGLLIINRTSANRIAKALTEMKLNSGASTATPPPAPVLADNETKSGGKKQSQELKFNDPIKMKELATRHIEFLTSSKTFPTHRDIFVLDKLAKEHPDKLGAILAEFPAEMQRKLFAYTSDFRWVEALNEPGYLDFECLEIFQHLTQIPREGEDLDWDHAVLAVWRLNEHRTQFIKGLPKDDAFALLADMPKAVAVSEARKSFPGAWAAILDPNFKGARIGKARIREIHESALRIMALSDIEMVKRYREEKEILEYLKTADQVEERDVYGAAPADSLIHKVRPPFFPLFDQSPELLQWFVPTVSIEHWSLALFNLPKSERAKVDAHLTEKQKFILVDRFKKYDAHPPERAVIGKARELIGKALRKTLLEKAKADQVNSIENLAESDDQNGSTPKAA